MVSEYESGSDILETQEIFDLGIPEILGEKISEEIYYIYILANSLQGGCDGTIIMYSLPVLLMEKSYFDILVYERLQNSSCH